jgi:hypothetical protein
VRAAGKREPSRRSSRLSAPTAVALAATLLSLVPIAALVFDPSSAAAGAGWLHRWCSPSSLGAVGGGVGKQVLLALEIHWPHFLPASIAIATLVYLRRADRRHRQAGQP